MKLKSQAELALLKELKTKLYKCECGTYTLKNICPKCGKETSKPEPIRFSPTDKYGEQRRKILYERS